MNTLLSKLPAVLIEARLIPKEEDYLRARRHVSTAGHVELERVIAIVGRQTLAEGIACLDRPRPKDDIVRVLGFGAALTDYAVTSLRIPDLAREEVLHLGALANLIVTLFDQFVDNGYRRNTVLSPTILALAMSRPTRIAARLVAAISPAYRRMMVRLVCAYFDGLGKLPHATARPELLALIQRAIARMYRAESRTLEPHLPATVVDLRRKAALPFVVMGLPGWLVVESVPATTIYRHVGWLYRLGAFIGYVDDITDLSADERCERSNVVAIERRRRPDAVLLRRLARLGQRVQNEWSLQVSGVQTVPPARRDALRTCVVSWLGGYEAIRESIEPVVTQRS